MQSNSKKEFRNTGLDPYILTTHFKFRTNWHVITGASCSGKTTLIDLLANKGFHTNPEVGREYIEMELSKGHTIEKIRTDRASLTRNIYSMMKMSENELNSKEFIFLDRALPDALTFFRLAGMDPNKILPDCFQYHYASVFLLERLPYLQDDIRAGGDESEDYFDSWMSRDYGALGYDIIKVPVLSPEERLNFVLDSLTEQGHQ